MLWGAVVPDGDLYIVREWPNKVPCGEGPYDGPVGEWVTPQGRIGDGQTRGAGKRVGELIRLIRGVEAGLARRLGIEEITVVARGVDKRFGRTPTTATRETSDNLIDNFARGDGEEPMFLTAAPTGEVDADITVINQWLSYEPEKPVVRGINRPRLHICDECQNLLWALQNWEWRGAGDSGGRDALKDPLKDPIDTLRQLLALEPVYLPEGYTGCQEPRGH